MTVRVFVVAPEEMSCAELGNLPGNQHVLEIVGVTTKPEKAIQQMRELAPDIVILDDSLADFDVAVRTKRLLELIPGIRIIALSDNSDHKDVIRVLVAGARGHLRRHPKTDELRNAIETVMSGRVFISTRIAANRIRGRRNPDPREVQDVLEPIASGTRARQPAHALSVGEETV